MKHIFKFQISSSSGSWDMVRQSPKYGKGWIIRIIRWICKNRIRSAKYLADLNNNKNMYEYKKICQDTWQILIIIIIIIRKRLWSKTIKFAKDLANFNYQKILLILPELASYEHFQWNLKKY